VFSVIFEVHPKREAFNLYLELAKELKPILEEIDGFIDNERYESMRRTGWILSLSTWANEKALVRWRTVAKHHETQERGRAEVFQDYHLRVGEVIQDSAASHSVPLVQQRFDETEAGRSKFVSLTELRRRTNATVPLDTETVRNLLQLDLTHPDLIDFDVCNSIYNKGKQIVLASWRDRASAHDITSNEAADAEIIRQRTVRIIRDYGMFDRRESPQYHPPIP
jgi:heme-degrading monooxygenase HmoA